MQLVHSEMFASCWCFLQWLPYIKHAPAHLLHCCCPSFSNMLESAYCSTLAYAGFHCLKCFFCLFCFWKTIYPVILCSDINFFVRPHLDNSLMNNITPISETTNYRYLLLRYNSQLLWLPSYLFIKMYFLCIRVYEGTSKIHGKIQVSFCVKHMKSKYSFFIWWVSMIFWTPCNWSVEVSGSVFFFVLPEPSM